VFTGSLASALVGLFLLRTFGRPARGNGG
jgi:hypothetical protein